MKIWVIGDDSQRRRERNSWFRMLPDREFITTVVDEAILASATWQISEPRSNLGGLFCSLCNEFGCFLKAYLRFRTFEFSGLEHIPPGRC